MPGMPGAGAPPGMAGCEMKMSCLTSTPGNTAACEADCLGPAENGQCLRCGYNKTYIPTRHASEDFL